MQKETSAITVPQFNKINFNESLIDYLGQMKLITRPIVRLPFLKVDRGYYAPGNAYDDRPQFPSHQVTLIAPSMHAWAVELLLPYLVPKIEQPIDSDEAVIGVRGLPRRIFGYRQR